MTDNDLVVIFYCALAYSGAFIGLGLNAILVRVLHVYNKYNVIVWVALINALLHIIFNVIFSILFGVWGIALSTSVTLIILIAIYIIYLQRQVDLNIFKDVNFSWIRRFIFSSMIIIAAEVFFIHYFDLLFSTDIFPRLLLKPFKT